MTTRERSTDIDTYPTKPSYLVDVTAFQPVPEPNYGLAWRVTFTMNDQRMAAYTAPGLSIPATYGPGRYVITADNLSHLCEITPV